MKKKHMKLGVTVDHEGLAEWIRKQADEIEAAWKRLKEAEDYLYRAHRREWRTAVEVYGEERVVLKGRTKYNAYPRRLTDAFEGLEGICSKMGTKPSELRRVARKLGAKR